MHNFRTSFSMSNNNFIITVGKFFASTSGSGRVKLREFSPKKLKKSCVPEVIKKLRRHPDYQDASFKNNLKTEAEALTDADTIMDHFFSSITHDMVHERIKQQETESELDVRRARAMNRVEEVARFQVKLLLRYVNKQRSPPKFIGKLASVLQMEYGPLHASLLINELLLEWNSSSLVIPKFIDPYTIETTGPVLVSATVPDIMQIQRQLSKPFKDYDEIELIFDAACEKSKLLYNLAKVIARHNSNYYYDVIFRNCQNFVLDALTAISCENKPEFKGHLREYFTHLKNEGRVKAAFETHQELDTYVRHNHATLTQENTEYLLAQYYLLHMQNVMKSSKLEDWNCTYGDCMMEFMEAKIDERLMVSFAACGHRSLGSLHFVLCLICNRHYN